MQKRTRWYLALTAIVAAGSLALALPDPAQANVYMPAAAPAQATAYTPVSAPAQANGDAPAPEQDGGWGWGMMGDGSGSGWGMMGDGWGSGSGWGMMGGGMMDMHSIMAPLMNQMPAMQAQVTEAVAELFDMTADELYQELYNGRSFADLAAEKGVSPDEVREVMTAQMQAFLDQAVADGTLTQEQADRALEYHLEYSGSCLSGGAGGMFGGAAGGSMMGSGYAGGMMGNGTGHMGWSNRSY